MNRRNFFKTVGIPALALPLVGMLKLPESDIGHYKITYIARGFDPIKLTAREMEFIDFREISKKDIRMAFGYDHINALFMP